MSRVTVETHCDGCPDERACGYPCAVPTDINEFHGKDQKDSGLNRLDPQTTLEDRLRKISLGFIDPSYCFGAQGKVRVIRDGTQSENEFELDEEIGFGLGCRLDPDSVVVSLEGRNV